LTRIREILAVPGIDEVTVGLNDLRLQLGVSNHFEVLASPVMDMIAAEVRRAGLPLHVGGLGRARDANLPAPSDLVYAQYPRLGATGAWLARTFRCDALDGDQMRAEIRLLRERLGDWADAPAAALEDARDQLAARAANLRATAAGHTA
jgi:hypothetical protein